MARYLKSVQIQGFKSFGLKTSIEFVDGITGVVGANGSGKSNVVEAIKWVLGEQSAKSLRGDKMEDVIFNGTRDRTPMSMAEVALTFDNENHWLPIDYNEVEINRRIFRSGEGQYSINKSRVRLKDVVELFLDTGVGRDSYAIFEQGKIDRLLSESPMERRSLFEDFAGISKFKFRKEEAEKKLENARINLERVNDVIMSLEKEVESLRLQAENASRYNDIRTSLRDSELRFEALRVQNFQKEIDSKTNQKRSQEEKLKPLIDEIKKKEEDLIHTETDIQDREGDYNRLRDEYGRLERDFGEIKSRLENNRDRKRVLENQLKSMESRLVEGEDRQKALNSELEQKSVELDKAIEEKEEVQDVMLEIQSRIDALHGDIRRLDSQILADSRKLGFEKIISKDDIDKQRQELIAAQTRQESFRSTLEDKWNQVRNLQAELEEKNENCSIAEKDIIHLKSELEKILKEIEDQHQLELSIKKDSAALAERTKALQASIKDMDRAIMESIEKQAAEIRRFTEKKPGLEKEIDELIALLSGLLTDKDAHAKAQEALEKLKESFRGYQGYYERILGILYSDEGSYTRKEEAQKETESIESALEENNKALERVRHKIRDLQAVREDIQNNYNKNDFELSSMKNDIKKAGDQLNALLESHKVLENQINSSTDIIKKKQNLIESMLELVDSYEEDMRELKSRRNDFFDEMNKKKIDFARVEEKNKAYQTEVSRIKNQLMDIQKMRQSYQADRDNSLAVIEDLEERVEKDSLAMEELQLKMKERRADIDARRDEIDGLQKSRKQIELIRREMEQNILKFEKMVMNLENAISERRGFLDSIIETVQKNYNENVLNIAVSPEDNFENVSDRINTCRVELQSLGDVNLLAIEQFQNAKERLEFLLQQKADSENAMRDIETLIRETNAKSEEQFIAAFEDIRKAFKKIFARLFDGGRADLVMENKEDVLNTGINIFAEPPGKKFQSISLLSGGERALVAIAVIFSILYLKPTPFVVLDEMDAPLDDDNIERFKSIVKDFRGSSQFVLVSHSKSTLEICDVLYGVTMEEQGVSKVVNVAFDDANVLFKTEEDSDKPE